MPVLPHMGFADHVYMQVLSHKTKNHKYWHQDIIDSKINQTNYYPKYFPKLPWPDYDQNNNSKRILTGFGFLLHNLPEKLPESYKNGPGNSFLSCFSIIMGCNPYECVLSY